MTLSPSLALVRTCFLFAQLKSALIIIWEYSCLENPMDGEAWQAMVHGVAKSWTRLSNNMLLYVALFS